MNCTKLRVQSDFSCTAPYTELKKSHPSPAHELTYLHSSLYYITYNPEDKQTERLFLNPLGSSIQFKTAAHTATPAQQTWCADRSTATAAMPQTAPAYTEGCYQQDTWCRPNCKCLRQEAEHPTHTHAHLSRAHKTFNTMLLL